MYAHELEQLKKLETEMLNRELRPAKPVGLRFDRLAAEGWLPEPRYSAPSSLSTTAAYWSCNCRAVAALLSGSRSVFAACEEPWAEEPPLVEIAVVKTSSVVPFDAVLADSSILLSRELRETLSGFRRVLDNGGRVVLLVANWEYEMNVESVRYDLSFKRYRGKVYAGLVKRTLDPATELEYVCLLDPAARVVRKMAELPREELRLMGTRDVPGLERLVIDAEIIKIPQATVRSLEIAGREAGFSRSVIAGAPGILAARMSGALPEKVSSSAPASGAPEKGSGPADGIHRALASSFPFVPAAGSPHLLAVFLA